MSLTLQEAPAVTDGGGDLASLVIKFHRNWHTEQDDPAKCIDMCRVANEVINLDAAFYGTDA